MGAKRFQGTLALGILGPKILVDLEFAERVVKTYRRKNKQIVAWWHSAALLLYKMLMKARGMDKEEYSVHKFPGLEVQFDGQSIWLPSGMGLHYPDLRAEYDNRNDRFVDYTYRSNREFVRIHGGVLVENLTQRVARDIVAGQLLVIDKRWRVPLMVHDELLAVAPDNEAEECLNFMLETMAVPPSWMPGLPLKAEGSRDVNYS